jgi:hypothetical protein
MTPTSRTLALLRAEGFTVQSVESWIPRLNIRRDLWGIGDVLAMKPGEPLLLVQCTSTPNTSARIHKAQAEPRLRTWLACGHRFEVWGWDNRGNRWECRRTPLTADALGGAAVHAPPRRKRAYVAPGLFGSV